LAAVLLGPLVLLYRDLRSGRAAQRGRALMHSVRRTHAQPVSLPPQRSSRAVSPPPGAAVPWLGGRRQGASRASPGWCASETSPPPWRKHPFPTSWPAAPDTPDICPLWELLAARHPPTGRAGERSSPCASLSEGCAVRYWVTVPCTIHNFARNSKGMLIIIAFYGGSTFSVVCKKSNPGDLVHVSVGCLAYNGRGRRQNGASGYHVAYSATDFPRYTG